MLSGGIQWRGSLALFGWFDVDGYRRSLMPKMPVYRVRFSKALQEWSIDVHGAPIDSRPRKSDAILVGKEYAKESKGQLVIHKKSGAIQTEYTYGPDPKNRKGGEVVKDRSRLGS